MVITQDLRESDDALRRFVQNAPVALAMFDRESRFIEVSAHWVRLLGKPGQSMIGTALKERFPSLPPLWDNAIQRGLKGESPRVGEVEWQYENGTSIWLRLELAPWRDAAGEIGGVVLFVENISSQKDIDAILRMLSVEVSSLDLDGFLTHCTWRISEILGLEWVQLARPCAARPDWAETIAICFDGQAVANQCYPLAGTPCDYTLRTNACIFPSDVSALFPDDPDLSEHSIESYAGYTLTGSKGDPLGFLTVMSCKPFTDVDQLSTTLRLTSVALGAVLERRRAEDAIRANEAFNRELLDTLTSHIAVLDHAGEIRFTNRAWNDFGVENDLKTLQGGIGVNYLAVCDSAAATEPAAARAAELIRDVISGRIRQGRFEYPCHAPDTQRWFNCTVKHFTDPAKGMILVSHADITEVKLAQRRSEELERKFRHLFESAPEAMVIVSSSGIIRLINRKAEAMFGYGAATLEGQSVMQLVQERGQEGPLEALKSQVAALSEADHNVIRGTFFGQRRDGSEFPVEISLSQFEGDDDEYFIVALRDVTARLEAEADRIARQVAERANTAKSTFLATMSHEIRTPLNAVLGLSEILARSPLSDDQAELLKDMRGSARHLLSLIDNVLDFSKIEAGNIEFDRTALDLHELIESNLRGMSSFAAERGVALNLVVDPDLPRMIISDQLRLRQIIYNLLGNAIKFSGGDPEREGAVTVRAELEHQQVPVLRLTVRDNGIGMSPEVLDKVFSPFTQATSTTTRRFGGTGLGLTITQRIVDGLGGTIGIDSAPGEGASVTVRLPLEPADDASDAAPALRPTGDSQAVAQQHASPRPILVVEDDPLNQKVIMHQLALLNIDAELAEDGVEALSRWQEGEYSLILADLHMPRMDGYALAREIREAQAGTGAHVPILALTANALSDEAIKTREAGFDAFITKPLTLEKLSEILGAWLPFRNER